MEPNRTASSFSIWLSVFAMAAIITALFIITMNISARSDATPSYQAQNLEVLKSAQPNDVLICVVENSTLFPITKWAALVQDNSDGKITIGRLDDHRMFLMTPKIPYPKLEQELGTGGCEIRIVPYRTGAAHSRLADILMHGLNPQLQTN